MQFFGRWLQLANSLLDFGQSESGQTDFSECLANWQPVECVSSECLNSQSGSVLVGLEYIFLQVQVKLAYPI